MPAKPAAVRPWMRPPRARHAALMALPPVPAAPAAAMPSSPPPEVAPWWMSSSWREPAAY